jgi:hypothetical protein
VHEILHHTACDNTMRSSAKHSAGAFQTEKVKVWVARYHVIIARVAVCWTARNALPVRGGVRAMSAYLCSSIAGCAAGGTTQHPYAG